jgi:heme/copper-type cytochrome/quinol oxidase subunit 3
MLELYFIFYRIPKMMSQLARERQRSALAWSLIGIAAWLGAEIVVFVGIGVTYLIVSIVTQGEVSEEFPPVLRLLTYVLALGAAIVSFLLTKRFLTSRPTPAFQPPPPPPSF